MFIFKSMYSRNENIERHGHRRDGLEKQQQQHQTIKQIKNKNNTDRLHL